jgi:hypothetical protein
MCKRKEGRKQAIKGVSDEMYIGMRSAVVKIIEFNWLNL